MFKDKEARALADHALNEIKNLQHLKEQIGFPERRNCLSDFCIIGYNCPEKKTQTVYSQLNDLRKDIELLKYYLDVEETTDPEKTYLKPITKKRGRPRKK